MKRSEILEIIAKSIELGYGNSFEDLSFEQQLMSKQVAGVVLQQIEEAGMLPPIYTGLVKNGERYKPELHAGADIRFIRDWEPENKQ
jgi:hypothetical protein